MDGLQEILYTLRQNKLRTIVTGFGVFWGIFMLIIMLGAGQGMRNGIESQFGDEMRDTMFIFSGVTTVPFEGMSTGRTIKYSQDDIATIKKQISGVRFISIENSLSAAQITYENNYANYNVMGIDDSYFKIKEKIPFIFGRKLNLLDERNTRKTTFLGKPVAARLFGNPEDAIGKQVKVNGVIFTVAAVFHDRSEREMASQRIYIPLSTFRTVFRPDQIADVIVVRPDADADGVKVEEDIVKLLKKIHSVAPDDRRAIWANNLARASAGINAFFLGINLLIWFVGLGTLAAGVVGVSNIMIITVKERTREIGIRKALGATPSGIVSTLVLESVLVTAIAGYLGLALGVALIEAIAFVLEKAGVTMMFFQKPEVNFDIAVTSIILLVSVGAIAGLIPALKAARIMPIEAMRAE